MRSFLDWMSSSIVAAISARRGSQDSSSSITTFGCLFDALLPVCFVSSFVGGEFEWEWGLFGCRGKENLDPQITQITQN